MLVDRPATKKYLYLKEMYSNFILINQREPKNIPEFSRYVATMDSSHTEGTIKNYLRAHLCTKTLIEEQMFDKVKGTDPNANIFTNLQITNTKSLGTKVPSSSYRTHEDEEEMFRIRTLLPDIKLNKRSPEDIKEMIDEFMSNAELLTSYLNLLEKPEDPVIKELEDIYTKGYKEKRVFRELSGSYEFLELCNEYSITPEEANEYAEHYSSISFRAYAEILSLRG